MGMLRYCDGPGCRQEQTIQAGDMQPAFPDPPWILLSETGNGRIDHHQFCSVDCLRIFVARPLPDFPPAPKEKL